MKLQNPYQDASIHLSSKQEAEKPSIWQREISFSGDRLSLKERQQFYHLWAMLSQSGLNIMDCLEVLLEQGGKPKLVKLLKRLQQQLSSGASLSEAAANMPKKFSLFETYHFQIGEQTGKMETVLNDLSKFYLRRVKLQRKLVQAFTYPISVIVIALIVMLFMIAYVVPMFKDMFNRFDAKLPYITEQVLAISDFVTNNSLLLFLGFSIGAGTLFLFSKHPQWPKWSGLIQRKTPVLGKLILQIQTARMAYSFGLMLKSRIKLDQTLDLLYQIVPYYPLQAPILPIKREIVAGGGLHQAFARHKVFPVAFLQIIKIGEKTANLDIMLEKYALQLEEESEAAVEQLVQLLEPLLILILGLFVGIILISMYLPMFELGNAIG